MKKSRKKNFKKYYNYRINIYNQQVKNHLLLKVTIYYIKFRHGIVFFKYIYKYI